MTGFGEICGLARISHNQVEDDVFHGMRGVRGMEYRVVSLKRLRRMGIRAFSTPFCGRDGESLGIRQSFPVSQCLDTDSVFKRCMSISLIQLNFFTPV